MDAFNRRWILGFLFATTSLIGQPAAVLRTPDQPATAMKTFVIIFRQGPRALTDSDKLRRAEETTAWARLQNAAGHKLDPRILGPESEHRAADNSGDAPRDLHPVTALLFLEARDLSDAARVAEAHPGLRYGAVVEVRPWAPPAPVKQAR